ncbi:MAG: hypothetical protein ABIC19_00275 [Patescibacteria group bacterium]|nr:hypothetical protein [Patescibacteria group bacterium]
MKKKGLVFWGVLVLFFVFSFCMFFVSCGGGGGSGGGSTGTGGAGSGGGGGTVSTLPGIEVLFQDYQAGEPPIEVFALRRQEGSSGSVLVIRININGAGFREPEPGDPAWDYAEKLQELDYSSLAENGQVRFWRAFPDQDRCYLDFRYDLEGPEVAVKWVRSWLWVLVMNPAEPTVNEEMTTVTMLSSQNDEGAFSYNTFDFRVFFSQAQMNTVLTRLNRLDGVAAGQIERVEDRDKWPSAVSPTDSPADFPKRDYDLSLVEIAGSVIDPTKNDNTVGVMQVYTPAKGWVVRVECYNGTSTLDIDVHRQHPAIQYAIWLTSQIPDTPGSVDWEVLRAHFFAQDYSNLPPFIRGPADQVEFLKARLAEQRITLTTEIVDQDWVWMEFPDSWLEIGFGFYVDDFTRIGDPTGEEYLTRIFPIFSWLLTEQGKKDYAETCFDVTKQE